MQGSLHCLRTSRIFSTKSLSSTASVREEKDRSTIWLELGYYIILTFIFGGQSMISCNQAIISNYIKLIILSDISLVIFINWSK